MNGYTRITTWFTHSGNIRKASLAAAPRYAYLNGTMLTEARWPDNAVIKNVRGTRTSLSSPQLAGVAGLVGSKVTVQNTAWSFESRLVTAHVGDTITLDYALSVDPQNYGWGFWFTGKLAFLTQQGEWFYDTATKTIYVNSTTPELIDFVTSDYLVYTSYNGSNNVTTGHTLEGARQAAVRIECGTNNGVEACTIKNAYKGVVITHNPGQVPSTGNFVKNSVITDCYETAINSLSEKAVISGNIISNIGMVPGLGADTWGYMAVSSSAGKDNDIGYNRIKNVGYIGIVGASNDHIHHNIVENWCMTLNDGGGIALDHSKDMVIEHNTLVITQGTTFPSCPIEYHGCALRRKGIYKGENTIQRLTVRNNVVIGAQGPGYFGDNSLDSEGDIVTRNAFIHCNEGYSHSDWGNRNQANGGSASKPSYTHKTTENAVFIKPGSGAIVSQHINAHTPIVDYGESDRNIIYCDDPNAKLFVRNGTAYTLTEWQVLTGKELNTVIRPYEEPLVVTNNNTTTKTFTLPGAYQTPWGTKYPGTATVPAFESLVLIKDAGTTVPPVDPPTPPVDPPTPPVDPPVPPPALKKVWATTFSGRNGCLFVATTGKNTEQATGWACGTIRNGRLTTVPCTSFSCNIPAKRIVLLGVRFSNFSDYGWLNSAVRTRANGDLQDLNGKVIGKVVKNKTYARLTIDLPAGTVLSSLIGPADINTCGGPTMTVEALEVYA